MSFSNFDKNDVLPYMPGMWQDALMTICGVDSRHFTGKHTSCPVCGGKDRFRFSNKVKESGDGGAYCNECGADSGIGWLMKLTEWSYSECIDALGAYLGKQPIEKVKRCNTVAKNTPVYSYGKRVSHESVMNVMSRTQERDTTPLSTFEGIFQPSFKVGVKTAENGSEEVIHALPLVMVCDRGLDVEFCNVLFIDSDGNERYMAKDLTFGAVIPVNPGQSDGPIYLTCSWVDACHINMATNREVWACGLPTNLEIVAHKYKGDRELRVACKSTDYEMLCMADERDLKVIIPNGGVYKMGMMKKLFSADYLIKSMSR